MRLNSTGNVGRLSPYYPHLKRYVELRNEIHSAILWMRDDEALDAPLRRLLTQYLEIAKSAVCDAMNEVRERYQGEQHIFMSLPQNDNEK